jgi:uncharacterized surface protein with fasciclin (FAS1) repeats
MNRKITLFIALIFVLQGTQFVQADDHASDQTIVDVASGTGYHESLVAALAQAQLANTLAGEGPFTVFAPTDQAFADAGIDLASFDTDSENQTLADILTYHVVSGKIMSSELSDSTTADALNGDKLAFTVNTEEVKVNGATVTGADVETSNGVIHVIDKVLMPSIDVYVGDGSMTSPFYQFFTDSAGTNAMTEIDITKNYKFQRLNNPSTHPFYISDSGYATEASAELLIAGDGSITQGISNDESFTVFFRNGFTVEDTLSYFCTVHSSMFADFTLTSSALPGDIPTVASSTGIHASLVAALTQADLVTTLQGEGPFTVFAPTDQAFSNAGIDISAFDTPEDIATLADILLYHVLPGAVPASAVTAGLTVTMANGDEASFDVEPDSGDVLIGFSQPDAFVVTPDVQASNGIIHVIDKVLLPPPTIPVTANNTGIHTALVAALSQANLVATLEGDGPFTVFAPTDDAFTAAGIDLSTFDTDEEIATLADILTYHVVSGKIMSSDLTDGMTATAVNTDSLTFTVNNDGVKVNDATVILADVKASNGVIHVVDKVLMPPADQPVVEEPVDNCDVTIGIGDSGYAYDRVSVSINVGETVCWKWTDSDMPHNVAEIDDIGSNERLAGGIYSGAAAATVDFSHTFTEDTTFYYACEPHITMGMKGEVIVGTGIDANDIKADDSDKSTESTPGFLLATSIIAMVGAILVLSRKS